MLNMAKYYVGVRLDDGIHTGIVELADALDLTVSETIRYLLSMALLMLGPDTTLEDIIKDKYIELLRKNPDAILQMGILDILPTYSEIVKKIKQQRGQG